MTNCKFNLTGKDKCKNIVLPGYQYCADHLNALTEHFVRDFVSGILIDHLMLNRSGFDLNSRIIDDMGADSLDTVELAMAVEEVFGLEIQDDEAEKIVTGFDIFEFVLQKLKDNEEYIVNSLDFRKSIEELKARPGSVQKQIDAISDSELMNDYLKKLGLKCIEFKYLLGEQISSNWIEHITTVPELDKNGKLDQSHVIILTQNYIFYYRLMFRSIFARMEDIREVEIFPKYEYDDVGKMSAIRTYIKMEDVGDSEKLSDETFKFSFYSEHGISEAKAFLNKYFRFRQMAWKRL